MSNIDIYRTTAYNCWTVFAASYHTYLLSSNPLLCPPLS